MGGKKSQILFSFNKKNQAWRSKAIHFIFFCQNEEEKQVFQLSSITDLTNVCHRQLSLNLKIFLLRIKKKSGKQRGHNQFRQVTWNKARKLSDQINSLYILNAIFLFTNKKNISI